MKLTLLQCQSPLITDIGVLKGMPLELIYLGGTKVTDLTPIKGMKLKELILPDGKTYKDVGEEFWKEYDAGKK